MTLKHLLVVATMTVGGTAAAQMAGMDMPASTKAASSAMTKGEALKVDSAAGKVMLRHGPIDNLGMPGMTMTFQVADKKLLAGVKDGDLVQFTAERVNGSVVVTKIEHVK